MEGIARSFHHRHALPRHRPLIDRPAACHDPPVGGDIFAGQQPHDASRPHSGQWHLRLAIGRHQSHPVGEELLQVAERLRGAELPRGLEPTAERHGQEHHAGDFEIDMAAPLPGRPGRLPEGCRHTGEEEETDADATAPQIRQHVVNERPAEEQEHRPGEQQAGMPGEVVEHPRSGGRIGSGPLLLRPEEHGEDHHVHREEDGQPQLRHHPARFAISATRGGDRGGEAAAEAAEARRPEAPGRLIEDGPVGQGKATVVARARSGHVTPPGGAAHGRWMSSTCMAGRR